MFAMFGASVLVPFMFGINPAIVLLMNGIGTLLFILITWTPGCHQIWFPVCSGRICCPRHLRYDRCSDHPSVWN